MKISNPFAGAMLFGVFLAWAMTQSSFAGAPADVLNHYLRVQETLARDSMKNVAANAQALAEAARADETQSFPAAIAEQADALVKARTLDQARQSFKPLSTSLIAYFKTNRVPPGTYYEVYCLIAKAGWLQISGAIKNPYLGPRSATPTWGWACAGVIKTIFETPSARAQSINDNTLCRKTKTYLALVAGPCGNPVGTTILAGFGGRFTRGNGTLFSGDKEAGFTFAFSRSIWNRPSANSNGDTSDGGWRGIQAADFGQFPSDETWAGIDAGPAGSRPHGLRLLSWSW